MVVTHDLELVHQFNHRIVTIENGRVVSDIPSKYKSEDISLRFTAEKNEAEADEDAAQAEETEEQDNG